MLSPEQFISIEFSPWLIGLLLVSVLAATVITVLPLIGGVLAASNLGRGTMIARFSGGWRRWRLWGAGHRVFFPIVKKPL